MALKDSISQMKKLLDEVKSDLDKAESGNKAAAQRVRTCTIKFSKIAKMYRKESVAMHKKEKAPKKKVHHKKASHHKKKAAKKKKR